jgi:hypothetical protein
MNTSTTALHSATLPKTQSAGVNTPAFWERLWRLSGVNFILFLVIASVVYGYQPHVGASADALITFFDGGRIRILIAAFVAGMALLNLLWFVAALRTTLTDAGQDGWGGAALTAGAAFGAMFFLLVAISAALAYSIAGAGFQATTASLNDFAWAGVVLTSFPRAMLIMAGSFGLWRAKLISNALFAAGVAAVVLVLLGGSTWLSGGIWAPDGAYSRFVSPAIGFLWILVVTRVLLAQSPAARTRW